MTNVGINGFGRIGRQVLKAINDRQHDRLKVVVINDLTDTKTNAHLFKYDSNYGRYPGKAEATKDGIVIDGKLIHVVAERDPSKIHWHDFGVDIVIESTGAFTDGAKAAGHFQGGAKKVIITAPSKNEDITIVLGVNEDKYDPEKHRVISNASCTTNGVAPLIRVLQENFGVNKALMSTIHAYTNDQRILDVVHNDLRRARAAALSVIPTTTGAAKAVTDVMPELKGRIHGIAFRVPIPTVSMVDLTADLEKSVTVEQVNEAFKAAANNGPMRGILEYTDEPLVSVDFKGSPASSTVDGLSTMVMGGNMVKVISWYDNEWGYSCRVADLAAYLVKKGL